MSYVGGQHVLSKQPLVSLRDSASSLTCCLKYIRFLDKMNLTGSTLQLVNGICLLVTFFCARIIYGGIMASSPCSFVPIPD